MDTTIDLVLFGDQTVEKLSSIQALVRNSKTSPTAKRFLCEATDIVQLEFAKLSGYDRAWDHEVHTLLGLAEDNVAERTPHGVLATVLMCIGRLGELIVCAEKNPSILGSKEDPVHVLAFCTGLLPAAALVAARDTNELFDIGIEIISITFRMTHEIIRRMKLIEDISQPWAMTVVGKKPEDVQQILDQFHQTYAIPYPKRVAIAVVSQGWLTLMGAPSSLSQLIEYSRELEQAPKTQTDTSGAVHTPFIPSFDVEQVLGQSSLLDTPISSKARMVSPGSCRLYQHSTLRALLAEVMIDIAHNVLHIDTTADACIVDVPEGAITLTVAGPTGHLASVERILRGRQRRYEIRKPTVPAKESTRRGGSDLIAIVGMSGRFPGSDTVESFFDDLLEGKSQIRKIPSSRFDLDQYFDASGEKRNTTSAQHGAFLENPGHFDHRLFSISPREAKQMDPIQRLLLTTSHEALESAGYFPDATPATQKSRIATYFGQASEDWRDILNNEEIDIYYVPSLSRPFGPSRLSYHYGWGGGTYAIDAACATSTTAIHLACMALKSRECDMALAGGGSILVSPNTFAGLSRSSMISDNGGCRTYHDDADGYVRGEGIGVVVLKRLEDALHDNDNIVGVIRGSARTYTSTSTSITHPSAESQARLYEEILRQTCVLPNEIAYVEMHGTGTQAGDLEEMNSVISVMGRGRSKTNILTVGAVKASVGHGEGAAGVTSLIKVLMMMRERKTPPQPGIPFKLNQKFPKLEKIHVQIAGLSGKKTDLNPSTTAVDGKIKCMVNSFDASGGNTSLMVEEPPLTTKNECLLPCHVVCISAKTKTSLNENRKRLLAHLTTHADTKIADLGYTTTARRQHGVLRRAYAVQSTREAAKLLREDKLQDYSPQSSPNMVFTFTGQGSQYSGMGRQLYRSSQTFRALLHTYQQIASHQNLPDFISFILDETTVVESSSAVCMQLAIVALEIAVAELLKSWGISPDVVVGHSLGEYSALCIAGVLSVSDVLFLVGRRAQLMEQRLTPETFCMMAISKDYRSTRQLLSSWEHVEIACINAPELTVVSGPAEQIVALQAHLNGHDSRATVLKVPYGFHSRHIEPILSEFDVIASGVVFSAPKIPVASSLLGEVVAAGKEGVFSASYLTRQAREPVQFVGAIQACNNIDLPNKLYWIEAGPEPVCNGLARRTLDIPATQLLPTMKSREDNWITMCSTLAALYRAGVSIDWPRLYDSFKDSVSLIDLPRYAFDSKDFWTPFKSVAPIQTDDKQVKQKPPATLFRSTSLQQLEVEHMEHDNFSATFASYTSEPNLYKAIHGHIVSGIVVCPLSIFCDMAKSAAQYAFEKAQDRKVPLMSITNLKMEQALVVPDRNPAQIIRTTVKYSTGGNAWIRFHSSDSGAVVEHGTCIIDFETAKQLSRSPSTFLMEARIKSLKEMSLNGKAYKLPKAVAYKLFDNLVTYGKSYQGMEEVWIDVECYDAVGTIRLPDTVDSGDFLYNPFWIDAAIHLAGFLLNGGLKYPKDIVCLSTGFESWRILEELQPNVSYTTYVSMQEGEGSIVSGSAYVFDANHRLIQVTDGISFLKLKKLALDTILLPRRGTRVGMKTVQTSSVAKSSMPEVRTPVSPALSVDSSDENDRRSISSSTQASSVSAGDAKDLMDKFLATLASESGSNVAEMENEMAFADMGMDSLMAITILATIHRDTGVELPATFLLDHPTIKDAKEAILGENRPKAPDPEDQLDQRLPVIDNISQVSSEEAHRERTRAAETLSPSALTQPTRVTTEHTVAKAKAFLLHGSTSANSPIFLLPDGSGSPLSYIQLPAINGFTTYGLESPFHSAPSQYDCNLETICESFVASIKEIQPQGGYIIGGYSLGAIYAYRVVQQLLQCGDQVKSLILIDMGVPLPVKKPLTPSGQELRDAGLISTSGWTKDVQITHTANTVRAMTSDLLVPMERKPRNVTLISSNGIEVAESSSELARWAKGHTSDSRGWERLVGPVESHQIDTDHFSIVEAPQAPVLAKIVQNTLEASLFQDSDEQSQKPV